MKLISYRYRNTASYGFLTLGRAVIDLARRLGPAAPTLKGFLAAGGLSRWGEFAAAAPDYALADVELLPVIPDPAHIVCIGLNYEEHRAEAARPVATHPTIFFRTPESLQADGKALLIPRESDQFDFEGELALIMGRSGRRIAGSDAWSYVAGVCCSNDATVREWQYHTHQFGPGKNFPQTGSLGPALVTTDELPENKVMALETRVNGKVVQHADTGQMIFSVPRLLEYISTFMTLLPGDVILTGTPGGVGAKRKPPLWLASGDVVEVDIEHVGLLSNSCRKEG
jgi:2-keto-4-pentenoate hydratase/2-oxohepta-3-ene-1,7-dioic acid hydratase in catechol pathway